MTAATNGAIFRVTLWWFLHAQNCYNVLHFLADGTPDIETGLIAALRTNFTASQGLGQWSNDLTLKGITAQSIYPVLGNQYFTPYTDVGAINSDAVPSMVALVAQIRTGQGGRSNRGRFYIPGLNTVQITDSRFTNATFDFLTKMTASFITPAAAPRWRIGVLSRKVAGTSIPVNPAGFIPATTLTFDPVLANMRSRRIGRGR